MGLRDNEITDRTTLTVPVRVIHPDGSVKQLAGATYRAVMGREGMQVTGTVTVVDALKGMLEVTFPPATGMTGQVVASLHVTILGRTECVWRERFQVFPELEPL